MTRAVIPKNLFSYIECLKNIHKYCAVTHIFVAHLHDKHSTVQLKQLYMHAAKESESKSLFLWLKHFLSLVLYATQIDDWMKCYAKAFDKNKLRQKIHQDKTMRVAVAIK